MKTKIFTSVLIATIIVAALVFAAVSIQVNPETLIFTKANELKNITISNMGTDTVNISISPLNPAISGTGLFFQIPDVSSLNPFNNTEFAIATIALIGNPLTLDFGEYSTTANIIAVNATNSSINQTKTLNLKVRRGFCSSGASGQNLSIRSIDINNEGEGEDDDWQLMDTVTIDVEVENNGNENMRDVFVEMGLFDSTGTDFADDLDFINSDDEKIDIGTIGDDESEEVTFKFRVPANFDIGDYKLTIKTYSDNLGEDVECADSSNDLSDNIFDRIDVSQVDDEERFIAVDDIIFSDQATCGETVSGSFTIFNIGEDDQDRVKITMKNSELSLDQTFEITEDLDQGEDKRIQFSFNVPTNVQNKDYLIAFKTLYDYRSGEYRQESKDTFTKTLRVLGCATTPPPTTGSGLTIAASLESDAKAGEELVVNAVFTNSGSESKTLTISATDFDSWAELISISPKTLVLNPGETKTSTLKFNVKEDASDSQSFIIEANAAGNIEVQEVEVNIEGKSRKGFNFSGLTAGNNLIWIIAIINVVLILLIIIVAVKLSRR